MNKKLYKSSSNKFFDGVCAGIAEYFNIDVTIVRLIWIIFLFTGTGFLAYFACMIVIPREPAAPLTDNPPYDPQRPDGN